MTDEPTHIVCTKCGKEKRAVDFFKMKTGERYEMCKDCLTMHIDNRKKETFLWILEKFDVPYIENVWIAMTNKIYMKNPQKFSSKSVIGQYLRSMNMSQYHDYTYADSDRLNFEEEKHAQEAEARRLARGKNEQWEAELKQKFEAGEISQAEYETLSITTKSSAEIAPVTSQFLQPLNNIEDQIRQELTEDDITYLITKWGELYKPVEWVKMETLYKQYAAENELNTDREETLKKICKVSLKMDQALDIGDIQGYKNLSAVYDQLRKSAKFTEAQNKEDQTREIDSVGELVAFVEREGGAIPLYEDPVEYPKDKVDFTIRDMQQYVNRLVRDELGLGDLIESFIKKTEEQKVDTVESIIEDSFKDPETDALTAQEAQDFQEFKLREIEKESQKLLEDFGG